MKISDDDLKLRIKQLSILIRLEREDLDDVKVEIGELGQKQKRHENLIKCYEQLRSMLDAEEAKRKEQQALKDFRSSLD